MGYILGKVISNWPKGIVINQTNFLFPTIGNIYLNLLELCNMLKFYLWVKQICTTRYLYIDFLLFLQKYCCNYLTNGQYCTRETNVIF